MFRNGNRRNYSGHPFFQRETRYSFLPKGEGIARFAGNTDLGLSSYEQTDLSSYRDSERRILPTLPTRAPA